MTLSERRSGVGQRAARWAKHDRSGEVTPVDLAHAETGFLSQNRLAG